MHLVASTNSSLIENELVEIKLFLFLNHVMFQFWYWSEWDNFGLLLTVPHIKIYFSQIIST